MERFSISFLCQQVQNICRLCGVDNPDKIPILGAEHLIYIAESDEPPLVKKIEQCVGIKVEAKDNMPQNICSLCVDKVNDFYEYRLMCEATNIQTRRILQLPIVQPTASLPKSEPCNAAVIALDDEDEDVKPNDKRGPKTRNRKKQSETGEPGKSEAVDSKSLLDAPSEKRAKYDFPCQYCNESYSQSTELERHRVVKHTPLVHKFGCGSCMEYFDTASEYKDHNLWHKLTRTSFGCFRCGKKFVKISTLNKHVAMDVCIRRPNVAYEVKLVPDMQCTLCQKVFKTRNLYEWHGCFMRARANCPKCGKHFLKKNLLIRHFMLYCSGQLPLLEPILIPKDEPGSRSVNGLTEAKRRVGRPSSARAAESMKEETLELPFPPLLDLPDLKSESNSIPDGHISYEGCTMSGTELAESQKRSSLLEETNKITTLLRSGEAVDGNTDINTINNMLSSVNEAIATISKVRKKKKKRDRLSSSGTGNAGDASEKPNPPMVVLSMANVKQEVLEDSNMLASLVTNSTGVENGPNEAVPTHVGSPEAEGAESDNDVDDYDNAGDSFAHHNDDGGDSDSDVEIISVEHYQPNNSGTLFATSWNNVLRPNSTLSHEMGSASEPIQPIGLQVKQEPMATTDGDESDFEGYEDASVFVAVKQEPMEETVETAPIAQSSAMEIPSVPSCSSYQALRIKIKKEKGLLNASVLGEAGKDPISTDPVSTPEENSLEIPNIRTTRADVMAKKPEKTLAKRNNNPPPVKRCLQTSTAGLSVAIKQEPLEADELLQERVSVGKQYCAPEGAAFSDTTVRIKQEPQEDDDGTRPCSSTATHPTDDGVVAFDGMRIKRERPDDDSASHKRHASSNESFKKSLNPLSLSGVRIATGKKSSNSQPSASAHKSSVMINPFALLKQKESVPTVAEQEPAPKDSADSSADRSERFGLPVISQVKSIDAVEHLSLTLVDTVAAVQTDVVEQQQREPMVETDNCDGTDNRRQTNSSPSSEPCSSEAVLAVASNVSPQKNDCELKIASVTSIPEDVVTPQKSASELKIASVTTIPEEAVTPQVNVGEVKITSVTTIPEDTALGCQSREQNNEQQTSFDDADTSDAKAIHASVPELDVSEDLTPQQVPNAVETSSAPVVKDHIEAVDAGQDDEKRTVADDEQKTPNSWEEIKDVSVAPVSPEDTAATSTDDEQQEPNNHDTSGTAETSGNCDTTAEMNSAENVISKEDEMDDKINAATCSEQQEEPPSDECSEVEEFQAETRKEFCVVANNDEVLVAKQ